MTQLAAALMKSGRSRAERISVAGFFIPPLIPIRVSAGAGPRRQR